MKKSSLMLLVAGLMVVGPGCAKLVRFETPPHLQKKKMKEDPPPSRTQAPAGHKGERVLA